MTQAEFESGRKEAILRAAEAVFAARSYEAASIRTIAAAAAVNPALIRYYFGAKDALYREIFLRRYRAITDERLTRLEAVAIVPNSRDSVRAIIRAWFEPFVARLDAADGGSFVRLLAREANDPAAAGRGIVANFLDPSARRCIERLAAALPDASASDISWGYQFCIAVMLSSVTGAARAATLAPDRGAPRPGTPPLDGMVEFAAAGLLALVGRRRG
jgi:AcrR family transcriptional regulator